MGRCRTSIAFGPKSSSAFDRSTFAIVTDVANWLFARCREIDPAARLGLNLMLTAGYEMIGTRFGRPLQFVERDGVHDCEICGFPHVHHDPRTNYRAIVLASEPISHEPWSPIPDRSVYEVGADCHIVWEELECEPA